MDRFKEFEPMFYPKSVAVVGVSADNNKAGNRFLKALRHFEFKGKLYPVHPSENEILGLKTYPSVRDIPEPVDFAYIGTPAEYVPQVIEDCVAKGVPAVEIFTAGFSEVSEEGRRLEQEIVALAKGKLRIIGPNCFGVYCPKGGLTLLPGHDYPKESGNVALISQSGGFSTDFIHAASGYGLRFSKVISYGNACDLNEADFLEYLASDPDTEVIAAYMEGVKDGKRFLEIAKSLKGKKPLIIWKGGLTETGKRAVRSHTGSLGGEKAVWKAFFDQTGAIMADGFEELLDTTAIFYHLPQGAGRRVAILGGGGGSGVAASDICERAGLKIPPSPPEVRKRLRPILSTSGTGIRNPIDIGGPSPPPSVLQKILETLLLWDGVDALITNCIFFYDLPHLTISSKTDAPSKTDAEKRIEVLMDLKRKNGKPIVAVLGELSSDVDMINMEKDRRKVHQRFLQAGIFAIPSLQRGAKALSKLCSYYEQG